ncbi:MAG: methyl-accepting chemotaxis protein [Dehalococcoidales bacterium]|nr:methyl-accepting chemotaxis protein [Dehalococcoidales bacterium]
MKLNIQWKLFGGFGIVVLLLIAVAVVSFMNMSSINNGTTSVYKDGLMPVTQLAAIDTSMKNIRGNIYKYILKSDERQNILQEISQDRDAVDKKIEEYKQTIAIEMNLHASSETNTIRKNEVSNIETNWKTYQAEAEKIIQAVDEGRDDDVAALIATGSVVVNSRGSMVASCTKLQELETNNVEEIMSNSQQTFASSTIIIIALAIFATVGAIGIAVILTRGITGPINKVKNALQKMARADLTESVTINSTDETGAMAKAYNETQKYLNELVGQLKESALQLTSASDQLAVAAKQSGESTQQVATSSQQMAKGAQEQSNNAQETSRSIGQLSEAIASLSSGATEQATSVQKAVSSITGVANTMSQVAENAAQAAKGAQLAAESANLGASNSKQTLAGMDKIKVSTGDVAKKIEELGARSTEIGKIVAVIDDIAAQTNLLALNAAIEAARAGEQGRGFAVVSDEVRKLAERTATATKEIAELISSVQKGVNEANEVMAAGSSAVSEGYEMALKAGESLKEILKTVSDVNSQVDQISSRAQDVNTATNDLVKIIDGVGRVTEQNTVATEQMSASATQVSKAVETVAGIAEENSAATEQVSASAQEMSAQVQEIVASAQTLKDMATTLEQSVAMFKVNSNK